MNRVQRYSFAVFLSFAVSSLTNAQTGGNQLLSSKDAVVIDQALGISFLKPGQAVRQGNNGYEFSLQSSSGNIRQAVASILISQKPSVDLSGTYGGRLSLDAPEARRLLENVVKVDTIVLRGLVFRRELWAVYAGMGAWEGVVNCYALRNNQYYNLCLNVGVNAGKPGETEGGEAVSAKALQARVAGVLTDAREPVIQQFNSLLSSFQLNQ